MVYYFTSTAVSPPATIYMGKDKFENEELIKHGWEEDVWFHVDKLSSAHVYLRLQPGQSWDSIPEELLIDLAQLTKANSIEGNKKDNMTIIYTPWSNLKKSPGMETGQVSFHKSTVVKRIHVEKRVNEIVNRLNKTRVESYPDLAEEKIKRQRDTRQAVRQAEKQQRVKQQEYIDEKRKEKEMRDYSRVLKEEHMYSNKSISGGRSIQEIEEDFM
ncbi:hypothetical protein HK105_201009 [Polyrhizophydium stewartii]|uniref:NFACT RNA-binding domain-containing protein n=1 Tax=Polyrhizophydium stewartii TaxID=2732419 RepID=A0ABR4NIT0_9FUNG